MIFESFKNFKGFKRFDGEIGLEIETESLQNYDVKPMKYWRTDIDRSLRNVGNEYILKTPLKYGAELTEGLKEFEASTHHVKFIPNPVSSSVHVHLNFLNENFVTLGNFLTTAVLCENLLTEYSGPDRRSNLFCLPVCDAEETLGNIKQMFQAFEAQNFGHLWSGVFDKSRVKYANINLNALALYGSIEVRSFRGETNIKEIQTWIDILYDIMTFSRVIESPREIINILKAKDTGIIDIIFGKRAPLLKCNEWEARVNKNIWYAASIAYSVKNWANLDSPVMAEFTPKVADIQKMAQKLYKLEIEQLDLRQIETVVAELRKLHEAKELKKIKIDERPKGAALDLGLMYGEPGIVLQRQWIPAALNPAAEFPVPNRRIGQPVRKERID